jgi:hypothetical protein
VHQQSAPLPQEPPDPMDPAEAFAADVSDRSLLELLQEPGSELSESIRRLLAERKNRQTTMSSFANAIL